MFSKAMFLNYVHSRATRELIDIFGETFSNRFDLLVAEVIDGFVGLEDKTAIIAINIVVNETIKSFIKEVYNP